MIREQVYAALFARLSSAAQFTTVSRTLKHWNDVPASDTPALFQAQVREVSNQRDGLPTVWDLHVDVYIYVNSGADPNLAPSQILNPLIDSVVAALAPDNVVVNKCTLGGVVIHAWVEGQIETDEGTLGDRAVAIIPVVIRTT